MTAAASADVSPCVMGLFVHPIKSAAAIAVDSLPLDDRGAVGDRRWLVVDPDGLQITARETPRMALVRPRFANTPPRTAADGALWLSVAGQEDLYVDVPVNTNTTRVLIWNDTVDAIDAGDDAAQWFASAIGRACRLVRLADDARRPLARKYAGPLPYADRRVAFSDGAPLLILGQASIDALNEKLAKTGGPTMTVARFRPNILLAHTTPHEEDTWTRVQIGAVDVGVGSTCTRCVMTTVDPTTAVKGVEPLRTLATYRREGSEVIFGMNATHAAPGVIHVGDVVSQTPR